MTDHVSNTASPNVDLGDYDPQKYCHNNIEHQGAEGIGIAGEGNLVQSTGGGDDVRDTGQQPGKTLL
jgi:hypothetical protein